MAESPMNMQDYEETYASFQLDVPEFYNFAFDVVDKWAEDRTKLALLTIDSDGQSAEHHTFWDLKVQSPTGSPTSSEPRRLRKATVPSSCSHATLSGTSRFLA